MPVSALCDLGIVATIKDNSHAHGTRGIQEMITRGGDPDTVDLRLDLGIRVQGSGYGTAYSTAR